MESPAPQPMDLKLFEVLVRRDHRRLLAYARSLVADEAACEDLVQEAFITAYRNLDRYEPDRDFTAWVRGIVRFKYLEHCRRRREQPLEEAVLAAIDRRHEGWDREAGGDADLLEALRACLGHLKDRLRRAVELFYLEGRSVEQVASATQASEAAVKKRLQRGRAFLADCLDRRLGCGGRA